MGIQIRSEGLVDQPFLGTHSVRTTTLSKGKTRIFVEARGVPHGVNLFDILDRGVPARTRGSGYLIPRYKATPNLTIPNSTELDDGYNLQLTGGYAVVYSVDRIKPRNIFAAIVESALQKWQGEVEVDLDRDDIRGAGQRRTTIRFREGSEFTIKVEQKRG